MDRFHQVPTAGSHGVTRRQVERLLQATGPIAGGSARDTKAMRRTVSQVMLRKRKAFKQRLFTAEPPQDEDDTSREAVGALKKRLRFLERELRSNRIHLQLYRFGGGTLFTCAFSLSFWLATGVGVPFHPVFAAVAVPPALGVIAMAFLLKKHPPDDR